MVERDYREQHRKAQSWKPDTILAEPDRVSAFLELEAQRAKLDWLAGRPMAAPATWPYAGHRTMEQVMRDELAARPRIS